jgi:hypothetical protein
MLLRKKKNVAASTTSSGLTIVGSPMCLWCLYSACAILPMKYYGRGGRMKPITKNTLFYGDNLIILREHIPSEARNARQK